jgi:hypothetical protein
MNIKELHSYEIEYVNGGVIDGSKYFETAVGVVVGYYAVGYMLAIILIGIFGMETLNRVINNEKG